MVYSDTSAFYGNTNLKDVKVGNGVTTIANRAFFGCSSLESFEFGSSTQRIGEEAFSDCTSMTSLTSHATVPPTCGTQALDDINKWTCKLYVPEGCETAYQSADQWKEFFFMDTFVDGIDHATTSEGLSEESIKSIYDLQGRSREKLRQGVNIVRMKDGTTKKVMVR